MRDFLKQHPKLVGLVGTLALAAGAYYGVPPEYSQPVLDALARIILGG